MKIETIFLAITVIATAISVADSASGTWMKRRKIKVAGNRTVNGLVTRVRKRKKIPMGFKTATRTPSTSTTTTATTSISAAVINKDLEDKDKESSERIHCRINCPDVHLTALFDLQGSSVCST